MLFPKKRPIIPPEVQPPTPRRQYVPSAEKNLAQATVLGTIGTTLGPGNQCRGRVFFDLLKPAIVILHGGRTNPSSGSLVAYYTSDVSAPPFDPAIGRLPLFAGRVAWLWSAGRWAIDVQLDQTPTGGTQSVDFDRFDVEDPLTALAWLNSISQPFFSGLPIITADKAIALGVTSVAVTLSQALNTRAVLLQNTSAAAANAMRVGFDASANHLAGVVPAAAAGIPLAVGEKLLLQGSTMPTSDIWVGSFVGAGTLSVTTWPWVWNLPV